MNTSFFPTPNLKKLSKFLVVPLFFGLTACGDEEIVDAVESIGDAVVAVTTTLVNNAPSVTSGEDQTVTEQANVNLSASASDSDGTIQSYSWSQTGGMTVTLSNSDSLNASFNAPTLEAGQASAQLMFSIVVTDDDNASASDSITITVMKPEDDGGGSNSAPVVDAGIDQSVNEQSNVQLSATASDTDGSISSYSWLQTGGASVNLNNADAADASFIAPTVSSSQMLTFSITVSDNEGATATDTVSVNVNPNAANIEPTVDAGSNQSVVEQSTVQLSASAQDSDGDISSYQWTQTGGANISLSGATSAQASFTAPSLANPEVAESYAFEVTVIDNEGATATDSITVTVQREVALSEDCTLKINPGDSFTQAFSGLSSGDTLCLNDGLYLQAMSIPSNINVRAVNDGKAEIDGESQRGEAWSGGLLQMKGSNSSVRGLRVHHAGTNVNACYISGNNNTMRVMSCSHGGSHKHKIPLAISGNGHLIEDSWFFGEGRYVVLSFLGENVTIRRNVVRWDSTAPNYSSEPNAGISIYNSSDVTIENNISLDYGTPETAMRYGGDFYSPQHSHVYPKGNQNNHWLGNIAINHSRDTNNNRGMRFDPDAKAYDNVVKDFYVRDVATGFVISPKMIDLVIERCTMVNADTGRTNTSTGGSPINCGGEADISTRYVNRVKTNEALFPWANEALIKEDMCRSGERQSTWCTTNKSLTDYVLAQ